MYTYISHALPPRLRQPYRMLLWGLQRAASVGFAGAMEGVIPEVSAGGTHVEEDDESQVPGAAAAGEGAEKQQGMM